MYAIRSYYDPGELGMVKVGEIKSDDFIMILYQGIRKSRIEP